MLSIADIFLFGGLGIVTGTLAGLFGLGGGTLIVPGLFYLFSFMDLPEESLMHLAAGTSMSIMIFTSAASTWAHQSKGNIKWEILKKMIFIILIGAVIGRFFSHSLPTELLEVIFGVFLVLVSIKILIGFKPQTNENFIPGIAITNFMGFLIGFKSGVLGVGGGSLSVPFLLYCGLPMKQASGTSASFTLPIAIMGTLAVLFLGSDHTVIPGAISYIYLPAVVMVAPFTMMGAPIGAHLAQIIPAQKLRRFFALCLFLASLKMLPGVGQLFVY